MRDPQDAPESTEPLGDIVRCDACPVLCRIRKGQSGACERYANVEGKLTRLDPLCLRFNTILDELVAELPRLRSGVNGSYPRFDGEVARRMAAAVWPHRDVFVTPMAAVAGSVADELMEALLEGRALRKACVNDGGDIALHLAAEETMTVGIVDYPTRPRINADVLVRSEEPTRGVATSGWRGRSQSLGIADAVTVLARSAAAADAAATLVGNVVDVQHPSVTRRPAREVKADSDLGDLPVTVVVGPLPRDAVLEALERGAAAAATMKRAGLIEAAYLTLQGHAHAC